MAGDDGGRVGIVDSIGAVAGCSFFILLSSAGVAAVSSSAAGPRRRPGHMRAYSEVGRSAMRAESPSEIQAGSY